MHFAVSSAVHVTLPKLPDMLPRRNGSAPRNYHTLPDLRQLKYHKIMVLDTDR